MYEFEEFIIKKYPNRSPKVLLQKFQDADGTWFYGVKEVQDQSEAWQSRQAEVDEKDKRIEEVLKMLEGDLKYVEQDRRENFEFLQMAMIRCLKDNIKVLRGDNA